MAMMVVLNNWTKNPPVGPGSLLPMEKFMKFKTGLMAAAACVMMASAAQAMPVSGQVSLSGYAAAIGSVGMGMATGIDFVQSGTSSRDSGAAGGITSFSAGSGSFTGFSCASTGGTCGSIKDLQTFNGGPISNFLTLYNGATTVTFDLAALTVTGRAADSTGGSISLSATGTINETGYDPTAGVFSLTAQGNNITSFSATTLATAIPEPASMALLGGSLAAVGLIRRKKA